MTRKKKMVKIKRNGGGVEVAYWLRGLDVFHTTQVQFSNPLQAVDDHQ